MGITAKYTDFDYTSYFKNIENENQMEDCKILFEIIAKHYEDKPFVWSGNVLGFGKYPYNSKTYDEWFKIGFCARKNYISLYYGAGFNTEEAKELTTKIGKAKINRGCINFKKLSDIDLEILEQLIVSSKEIS